MASRRRPARVNLDASELPTTNVDDVRANAIATGLVLQKQSPIAFDTSRIATIQAKVAKNGSPYLSFPDATSDEAQFLGLIARELPSAMRSAALKQAVAQAAAQAPPPPVMPPQPAQPPAQPPAPQAPQQREDFDLATIDASQIREILPAIGNASPAVLSQIIGRLAPTPLRNSVRPPDFQKAPLRRP